MKLKVNQLGKGLHPSELLVSVQTANGTIEEVLLDKSIVLAGFIDVGSPLAQSANGTLVELPRETTRGQWRVWVGNEQLQQAVQ